MALTNEEQWNSSVNCQQFCRKFITDGLGLVWPVELDICGDFASMPIEIGIRLLSSSNNIKYKHSDSKA